MIKTFFSIFLLLLCSCSVYPNEKQDRNFFLARVTFYTDCPIWGKKTASGEIAEQGTTVAAARSIPYGTVYNIPRLKKWLDTDGEFRVDDRGPAVDKRVASNGKLPVIDVYVSSHRLVEKFGAKNENIFKVYCD